MWDTTDPYLYDVYSILTVNGQIVDVCKTQTGFRKAEYKGGAGTGGVWLNDHFVWLTGYAQRSADDWPGLGGAYPDWMHDFTAALVRESHGNYIRWMHVSPERADVAACDKNGVAMSARPATRNGTSPAASGTSASKSCATRLFFSATTPASCSGKWATPASPRSK